MNTMVTTARIALLPEQVNIERIAAISSAIRAARQQHGITAELHVHLHLPHDHTVVFENDADLQAATHFSIVRV